MKFHVCIFFSQHFVLISKSFVFFSAAQSPSSHNRREEDKKSSLATARVFGTKFTPFMAAPDSNDHDSDITIDFHSVRFFFSSFLPHLSLHTFSFSLFLFMFQAEWADVVPIPQDDGPNPVVPLNYSESCLLVALAFLSPFISFCCWVFLVVEAMNYFRAILKKDERSERGLKLSALAIDLNPSNYSAWFFRRQCLAALHYDIAKELKWGSTVAQHASKNYQLWLVLSYSGLLFLLSVHFGLGFIVVHSSLNSCFKLFLLHFVLCYPSCYLSCVGSNQQFHE